MELTGQKTHWGWVLLISIAAWYILLKGKPELCVAERGDMGKFLLGKEKLEGVFLNGSQSYCSTETVMRRKTNLLQGMMVTLEVTKTAKRMIRQIHKKKYSGIKKASKFIQQLIQPSIPSAAFYSMHPPLLVTFNQLKLTTDYLRALSGAPVQLN